MSDNWKPGDLAQREDYDGLSSLLFRTERGWVDAEGDERPVLTDRDMTHTARRLVVIDVTALNRPREGGYPNYGPAEFARTLRLLANHDQGGPNTYRAEVVREVAELIDRQPQWAASTPPKPEEPTGLGAVVEDAEGVQYVLVTGDDAFPWAKVPAGESLIKCFAWQEFSAARVLSEGVTP